MARELHVVMLPWLAFGHMIPFLQLSLSLARAGVRVSYISTPRNIERLPRIPPSLASLIKFISLPLPTTDGLPDEAEATVDVPFEQIPYLKIAYDQLYEAVKRVVLNASPDWIICDIIPHWAVDISQEFQVPLIIFAMFSAAVMCFVGPPQYLTGEGQKRVRGTPETMTSPPEWVKFPSSVAFRPHEAIGFHVGALGENASGISDCGRVAKILNECHAVALRSCKEYEGIYIDLYQTLVHKPVIPVGFLPPEQPENTGITNEFWNGVFQWLDGQTPRSIVFVGFGSEYKLTRDEVYEMAYGLEHSQLPFLWALRRPVWAFDNTDALPKGFTNRTSGRGKVCMGWVPQLKILAHRSIGGSLFHSGWGSIIETLQYGHKLVVLPFIIDQGLNARLLVEKGLALEVERREDGSFSREDIANALRQAMVGKDGEKMKVRAEEVAAIFGDRKLHEEHYIGGFVEYLRKQGNNL